MDVEQLARDYLTENDEDERRDIIANIYRALDKLIYKVCNRYAQYAEMDDMRQEAYFAIVDALNSWEPDKARFITHVGNYIKWHEIRCIERENDIVNLYSEYRKYEEYSEKYYSVYGEYPKIKIISAYFGVDAERVRYIRYRVNCHRNRVSFNDNVPGTDTTYKDIIPDDSQNTEEDALKRYESDQIRSAVGSLPEDEREVIERKFFNLQPVGHEGMKVYQKAIKDLRKNKTIRHMIMEDACISRAYDWHDRDTSHTEWCAIKLTEGD